MNKVFTWMGAMLLAGTASAHTGHSTSSFFDGWLHFLEWEHLSGVVVVAAVGAALTWLRRGRSDDKR